jgi:hypothetical protein
MKKPILTALMLLSCHYSAQAAESVNCVDPSGSWKVNFNLSGNLVSNLEFIFMNEITASFPTMKAMVNRIRGKIYYDINFNSIYYFDFHRVKGSTKLNGAFLIPQNSLGFETNVTCNAN